MRVNKDLVKHVLDEMEQMGDTYKPTMFSKNTINKLLETSDYFCMAEYYFAPNEEFGTLKGSKLFKEGEREMTNGDTKRVISTSINNVSKCLYDGKKFGNRVFVCYSHDEEYDYTEFYVITRDLFLVDLALIFGSKRG
jgi:hypothetical protein